MRDLDNEGNVYHLLVRYTDNFGPIEGTIREHLKVIKDQGYVWFGKYGQPISASRREAFLRQIAAGTKTYLLLMKSIKNISDLSIAELEDIKRNLPGFELYKVPEYYRKEPGRVGTYLKIRRLWSVDMSTLRSFRIASSGFPALESISHGMCSFFFLIADEGFSLAKVKGKQLLKC